VTGAYEVRRGEHAVSDDPARLDLGVVHGFLSTSYWAAGIPEEVVRRSIAGSLAFGLYRLPGSTSAAERQLGFARVVTDRATYAYLADVFVLAEERGRGLGTFLMEAVMVHPDLQGLRRWTLMTRDAHALYRRFGFASLAVPERAMERVDPEVYRRGAGPQTGPQR
jgi:GNAT superfamily N-acetyltransferase